MSPLNVISNGIRYGILLSLAGLIHLSAYACELIEPPASTLAEPAQIKTPDRANDHQPVVNTGEGHEASGTQATDADYDEDVRKSPFDKNAGVTLDETLVINNLIRHTLIYLPCKYRSESKYKRPLVIVLHGARLNGKIAKLVTGFDTLACKEDFVVAYPNAINKQWNDGRGYGYTPSYHVKDNTFILRLVKILESKYNINPKRVYLVGYSSGGMLAQKVAMESSNKIAGIAVVAATIPVPQYKLDIEPDKAMPVVIIHGTKDQAFPWEGGDTRIVGVKVGPVIAVEQMLQYWLKANGGIDHIKPLEENITVQGSEIEVKNYITKKDTQVTLFKVNGGGHTWPGAKIPFTYIPFLGKQVKSLNAAEVIWSTLSHYKR